MTLSYNLVFVTDPLVTFPIEDAKRLFDEVKQNTNKFKGLWFVIKAQEILLIKKVLR